MPGTMRISRPLYPKCHSGSGSKFILKSLGPNGFPGLHRTVHAFPPHGHSEIQLSFKFSEWVYQFCVDVMPKIILKNSYQV